MKKKLFWVTNFAVLGLFTLYSLVIVLGIGAKQTYARSLGEDNFYKKSKHFMVVKKDEPQVGASSETEVICSLNEQQVAELDAFFRVNTFDVKVAEDDSVTIAAVSGRKLTKRQLMEYLRASDSELECKLVHHRRVFFFPVLPQIS